MAVSALRIEVGQGGVEGGETPAPWRFIEILRRLTRGRFVYVYMVPVPVPMSSIMEASSGMVMAAPSNTPSVLTFIAERVLETQNCLNLKTAIFHY